MARQTAERESDRAAAGRGHPEADPGARNAGVGYAGTIARRDRRSRSGRIGGGRQSAAAGDSVRDPGTRRADRLQLAEPLRTVASAHDQSILGAALYTFPGGLSALPVAPAGD